MLWLPYGRLGSALALCEAAEPGGRACEAIRERRRLLLLLFSILPSSTVPSVCQDKQMRRHMLERLLEDYWKTFSIWARWKEACNTAAVMLLLTVNCVFAFTLFHIRTSCRSASITLNMCYRLDAVSHKHIHPEDALSNGITHPGFIKVKLSYAHTQRSVSLREKQTNEKLNITVCSIATSRWQLN